jgi:hypothetical protein
VKAGAIETLALHRLMPLAELLAVISLLVLFVVKGFIPACTSLRSDFPNYYIVARLLREHYALDRIYDWIWLQRVKDHWSIPQSLVGFVGLTPFSVLPLVPFTWLEALEAKRVWLMLNLAILGASLYGMQRLTSLGFRRVALIAFLAIIPLRNNFLNGQMHLVVLGLLVLAYWLDANKKWMSCAMVLAIAASLKIYPLFFLLYFARKREWKPAVVLVGTTVVIFAACFLIFGSPVMHVFLTEQFPRMLRGEATDPFSLTAPSGSSLFHRFFLYQSQVNPHPLVSSPLLYAFGYPLWQLCFLTATFFVISPTDINPRRRKLEWASWICLLLTLSTEPASYHKVVLILVTVLAVDAIESVWVRVILIGCYFIACNAHPAAMPQHPAWALIVDFLPYWGLVTMLACLLISMRALRPRVPSRPSALVTWPQKRIAWALAGFASVWGVASVTTFVHAKTLNNAVYRSDRADRAFAQFDPHLVRGHLLTVAMVLQGYRIEGEDGEQYLTSDSGIEDDQLAFASSSIGNELWIEEASEGHSRLVELPIDPNGQALAPTATILDAESPALSADGKSLVFLREIKGAGQAWMVRLDESGKVITAPTAISPPTMDVHAAAFNAQGALLLTTSENGVAHLYMGHGGDPLQRVFSNDEATGWPAAHAESAVLVHEQMRDGYWRLFASHPSSGVDVQLTFGDCNAYDPAWLDATRVIYISDCGHGIGQGAPAEIDIGAAFPEVKDVAAQAIHAGEPQGDSRK